MESDLTLAMMQSAIAKVILASIAAISARLVLRQIFAAMEFDFKEWFKNASEASQARYLSTLTVCVFVLFAWVLG